MKSLKELKDEFAISEGWDSWEYAMEQMSKCDNLYLLDDLIDKWQKHTCEIASIRSLEKASQNIEVKHICDKCNETYPLKMGHTSDLLIYSLGSCPFCKERNDVWIEISKPSTISNINIVKL